MKNIYLINKIVIVANLLLYITIYGGLLFQMVTGTIQLLSFFIYLLLWKKLDKRLLKHFLAYGICTFIILIFFFTSISFNHPMTLVAIITSALLAAYFLFISKWQTAYILQTEKTENL